MQFLLLLIIFRDKYRFTIVEFTLLLTMQQYEVQRKSERLQWAEKCTLLIHSDEVNLLRN